MTEESRNLDQTRADLRPAELKVIVFASQKGGSGKTTVSAHMAIEAEKAGDGPVVIIDTDPQGSMAKWWNAREGETPAFAQVSVTTLARDLAVLAQHGYRLAIIDTPPAVTSTIAEVITHADLVVLPTRPSPHDLRAVGPTVDIVEMQAKPLVFVVNSATARARITGETAVALSQHGTVAPVTLHHRVDFAASMIDGRSVSEVNPSSRSAGEVSALWAYLSNRLFRQSAAGHDLLERPSATVEADILTPGALNLDEMAGEEASEPASPSPVPRFGTGLGPPQDAPAASNTNWDGVERRNADLGPPAGTPDRRRQTFGRRFTA